MRSKTTARYRETHPGARQPDPRLFHPRPSRTARLRLRAHLRPGGLSRSQGQRQREIQTGARADKSTGKPLQAPGPVRARRKTTSSEPRQPRTTTTPNRQSRTTRFKPRPRTTTPSPHEPPMMRPSRPAGSRACRRPATTEGKKDNFPKNPIAGHGHKRSRPRSARSKSRARRFPRSKNRT